MLRTIYTRRFTLLLISAAVVACTCGSAFAQETPDNEIATNEHVDENKRRLDRLESQLEQAQSTTRRLETRIVQINSELNHRMASREDGAAVLVLFGFVCALWAQNTDRNPWLWFFMGLIFNLITFCVLLSKNASDKKLKRRLEFSKST